MKKIRLKQNHIIKGTGNYIENYLLTLGIAKENISSFLGVPPLSDEDNPYHLENMQFATNIAKWICYQPDAKVFVQVDSDCDGYTSAAIVINYLKRKFPNLNISYRLHNGKEHGIILDTIPEDTNLVIVPDAGSNQVEEINALAAKNIAVIVLDHHEVNENNAPLKGPDVVIVNNQISPAFQNKYMSGAGIAYMFCKAMDCVCGGEKIAEDYRDLAAVGIIADAMNMTSPGNNFLAYHGLSNMRNKFIKELAIKQARGIKNPNFLTKMDVAFYIAPVINGVIRSGSPEDKEVVFRALVENDCTEVFKHEWRGKITDENLYQHATRLAVNAKSRQDSGKKKSFEWLCDKIEFNNWNNDNLIIATLNEAESAKVSANITGLIAMELVKYYNRPCLVLRETEFENKKMYGGSGRNGNFYGLESLLDFLHESNLVYYAEGHASAHGVFVEPEKIQELRDYANRAIDSKVFDDQVFEVDYWFAANESIDQEMLYQFASCERIYGNSIPRPKFAFDIDFESQDILVMGENKTSLKINKGKIDFVAFKDVDLVKQISEIKNGSARIIGRPQLNEWKGSTSVQVMIEDIDIQEKPKPVVYNSLMDLI